MVVFKITNNITGKHYIGTSFNSGFQRFEQYIEATNEGLDFPLYDDIRENSAAAFTVEELFETGDKQELYELEQDYISIYNGESLRGYKIAQTAEKTTSLSRTKKALFDANGVSTAEQPKKNRKSAVKKTVKLPTPKITDPKPTTRSFFNELIDEGRLNTPTISTTKTKKATLQPKNQAGIQKALKQTEKTPSKGQQEPLKSRQAQAEEMALIMAKREITSKSATSTFRRKSQR